MLAMNLEDRVHSLAELAHGERRAVDERASASAGGELALHDQLDAFARRLDGDAQEIERIRDTRRQMKNRLGAHLVAAGTDHLRRAARAAQKLERIDQQ